MPGVRPALARQSHAYFWRHIVLAHFGTVATVIAARDDRLNRNIGVQRYPFLLCRSRSTTIALLEDGAWASVAHDDLALEEISSRLKRSYCSAEEAGLSIILQNRELPKIESTISSVLSELSRLIGFFFFLE